MRAFLLLGALLLPTLALAQTPTVAPVQVVQGEPFVLNLPGTNIADIRSITFKGGRLKPFVYQGTVVALGAIALETPAGTYPATTTLVSGASLTTNVVVVARPHIEKPLDIPQKLGGNTAAAAKKVVSTLQSDNAKLVNLKTQDHALWSAPFIYPVKNPVVTDTYGYQRDTVGYEIAHKGTDFHAPIGTPVYAMNRGVVRLATTFGTYGKTVVIDHGLGLYTFYMHLSKIKVTQGQLVAQGQQIALSGDTGYAEGAHLHLTVRIGNTSVDPEKFLTLLQ